MKTSRPSSREVLNKKVLRNAQARSVTLIGLGNWGTSLGIALQAAGIAISEIIVRPSRLQHLPTRRMAKKLGAQLVAFNTAQLDAEILWICTPDAVILTTALALAQRGLQHPQPIVLHSSGMLSSDQLTGVRDAAASVASIHPLTTFPNKKPTSLTGVPFAVEGDARALQVARQLVRQMGGQPFSLRANQKAMYHAYATFTSPLLTALLTATQATGRAAGFSAGDAQRRMRPIVERTMANFFTESVAHRLSGPVARGDAATVARHLAILQSHPELKEIYRALQSFAVSALPGKSKPALAKVLKKANK